MNQGVQAYKNNHYAGCRTALQRSGDARSQQRERAALSGDVVHDPVGSRGGQPRTTRRITTWPGRSSRKFWQKNPNNSLALASMASMAYNSASAGTPEQKSRGSRRSPEMERAPNRSRSERCGSLLLPRRYRLGRGFHADQTARVEQKMKSDDPGPHQRCQGARRAEGKIRQADRRRHR